MKQLTIQHRQFFLLAAIALIFLVSAAHSSFAQAGVGAKYAPLEKTMYVYIKPKVANTPTEFQMEFRDKDDLLMQDREVSYFHLMPGTNDANVGDTVKVYVTTPTEKNLEKIATAKVVRIVK